ncbi:MAG: hypothetical protein ABSD97_07140 [Acidimicrobiales bacterium]
MRLGQDDYALLPVLGNRPASKVRHGHRLDTRHGLEGRPRCVTGCNRPYLCGGIGQESSETVERLQSSTGAVREQLHRPGMRAHEVLQPFVHLQDLRRGVKRLGDTAWNGPPGGRFEEAA